MSGMELASRSSSAPGRSRPSDVVRVARDGAGVRLADDAVAEIARSRAVDRRRWPSDDRAALRRLHRLRRAGHQAHPRRAARPAAAQPGPLARGRLRARGRARGGPRADAAAAVDAGHRPHRRPPGDRAGLRRAAQRRHHPGRARVRLARLLRRPRAAVAHCALALMGEGDGARRGRRAAAGRARRCAAAGIEPVELAEKEGLALINGTDGMLGMLVLAARRPAPAAAHRRHRRRDERRGAARHRRGLRRRPAGAAPAPGPGRLGAANLRALLAGSRRSWPATAARSAPACRTPTRCAARRRCTAPARDTVGARRARSPAASWPPRSTTRWSPLDGRVRVQRQLPRRPGRLRAGLPGHRRRRRRLDQRAAHRPVPRRRPQPRPAAVPGRRPRRRLRPHDRPVHRRPAIVSELKRLAVPASVDSIPSSAMQEDHVSMGWSRRPQAAPRGRRARPGCWRSRCSPPPGRSTCARR